MLSPDYLAGCADDIVKMYQALADEVIKDVARRLVSTDFEMTQSALWQTEKLQQSGKLYDDVMVRIAEKTGETETKIKKVFSDSAAESLKYDDSIYKKAGLNPLPLNLSPGLLQTLTAGVKKCSGELKNLTLTTANTTQTTFISAADFAYMKVSSGAFDYNTAIKQAVASVSAHGVEVLYPSGRVNKIDVAMRRAVLTGINQTCGQLQMMRADEMGCDLVETTAHAGARPNHAEWQGQIFSRSGKNKKYPDFEDFTGYGSVAGLMGANCRHNFFPFFEGISERAYPQEELQEYREHTVTYNGAEYSDYNASQIQRKMERGIREAKNQLIGFEEGIRASDSPELQNALQGEFNLASVDLKRKEAKLRDFLKQTGRAEDRARVQVYGFGREQVKKATQSFRRQLLPNYKKAAIPDAKISGYALNMNHPVGKNKAIAFSKYLGYNTDNKELLLQEVRQGLKGTIAKRRTDTQYGTPFEVRMKINGANGKQAHIKTGWIIDAGAEVPRLTSIYVDERK